MARSSSITTAGTVHRAPAVYEKCDFLLPAAAGIAFTQSQWSKDCRHKGKILHGGADRMYT